MNTKKVWGAGIVGAGGWGGQAHIPALAAIEAYEVKAVTGTRVESAQAAAEQYGIASYYTSTSEMAEQPEIDVVAVTVKVPEHDRLLREALEAGKHVYSEWPLARNTAEAQALLELAEERGVKHVAGLQARGNPAVRYIRDLVTEGAVGHVLAVNAVVTLPVFPTSNGIVDLAHVYLLDEANGADQLTIGAAHVLDAIEYMVAPFVEVSGRLDTQYPEVNILETGQRVTADAPDHVLVHGRLAQNAIVSAQFVNAGAPGFTLRIIGTVGELLITPRDGLMFQMDRLTLQLVRAFGETELLETPAAYASQVRNLFPGPGYNVAHLYALFAQRLAGEEAELPDFSQAVRLHRLLDAIRAASASGVRQEVG
ncbi:Gfo/Idh/MocA family oxidoreductase [Paenibacillus tritici]|uniref:Gfo/Idh/MocA family oxidoreductase n=1 Tax=Paenibacillus tritici TaxID=1873425 RepID=A0ABX2DPZ6_9BACL|nr:Gfo/Idh/MocA family oxidoreductase [Paenibacillus tritici]NQX46083.1 Gfo/Idh/MocA family oxidoreductase [Paenibacillus tritici]